MPKNTRPYRAGLSERLLVPEQAASYLDAAMEDSPEVFLTALKDVAQAHQMARVAKEAGIKRETLYRSFSSEGNPTLDTLLSVLSVFKIKLRFTASGLDVSAATPYPVVRPFLDEGSTMADYKTVDKTGWFIEKMRSGYFSRQEIVNTAQAEFPNTLRKTLDGTIGQYWSDAVNPKWPTFRAIEARGFKVVESNGRRHIVSRSEASITSTYHAPAPRTCATPARQAGSEFLAARIPEQPDSIAFAGTPQKKTRVMWNSNDCRMWQEALGRYWTFVKASNMALEREMDRLNAEHVRNMDERGWYDFLLNKYFRWKYTAPNRYASTTASLRNYAANDQLTALHGIKERLFALNKCNVIDCLNTAISIRGLGTAGASGLLAVLFPEHFGTVDQFVVKALAQIPELPEYGQIRSMNPESLKLTEGVVLIQIMRRKAAELNRHCPDTHWTPRRVDMVLWTCAR